MFDFGIKRICHFTLLFRHLNFKGENGVRLSYIILKFDQKFLFYFCNSLKPTSVTFKVLVLHRLRREQVMFAFLKNH